MKIYEPDQAGACAVVLEDGSEISHEALAVEISRVQAHFAPRSLVFILCGNDHPSLVCYLASLQAGAVPLLLPRQISAQNLISLIDTYQPCMVVGEGSVRTLFPDVPPGLRVGQLELLELHPSGSAGLHDDLALLLATSGSTGSPKLVRLSHRNLTSNADSIISYLGLNRAERAITTLPMHYSYGLSVIHSHLRAGASLALTGRSVMESAFWQFLRSSSATSFSGVPYTYDMLLRLRMERLDFGQVRTLTQAGGRMAPDRTLRIHDDCTSRGRRLFTMYGQTEATARMSYLDPELLPAKAGSIGRPIPGGTMWLEDDDGCRLETAGVAGELVYSGPNVCLGYASHRMDLSLGDSNQGILRTGDLARFDEDGCAYIVGRKSRFLKIFGNRISLDAVESLLNGWGWEGAAGGSDDRLVVHLAGGDASLTGLAQGRLSDTMHLHPSAIQVRLVEALPRLSTGKIDYKSLA